MKQRFLYPVTPPDCFCGDQARLGFHSHSACLEGQAKNAGHVGLFLFSERKERVSKGEL